MMMHGLANPKKNIKGVTNIKFLGLGLDKQNGRIIQSQ
jgi:hypothetical protein